MLVIIHFRKYHIWNIKRKRTDQSIFVNGGTQFYTKFAGLLKEWPTNRGKRSRKSFQTLERQSEKKRNTGLEDRAGNLGGTKIGN